eukprot:5318428-Prymnesium_polylepis.1
MSLGACGSAVSAACMPVLRGCMSACEMCATSAPAAADGCMVPRRARLRAHLVTTAESRSDSVSDAVTCESIGGTLGSHGISA